MSWWNPFSWFRKTEPIPTAPTPEETELYEWQRQKEIQEEKQRILQQTPETTTEPKQTVLKEPAPITSKPSKPQMTRLDEIRKKYKQGPTKQSIQQKIPAAGIKVVKPEAIRQIEGEPLDGKTMELYEEMLEDVIKDKQLLKSMINNYDTRDQVLRDRMACTIQIIGKTRGTDRTAVIGEGEFAGIIFEDAKIIKEELMGKAGYLQDIINEIRPHISTNTNIKGIDLHSRTGREYVEITDVQFQYSFV